MRRLQQDETATGTEIRGGRPKLMSCGIRRTVHSMVAAQYTHAASSMIPWGETMEVPESSCSC